MDQLGDDFITRSILIVIPKGPKGDVPQAFKLKCCTDLDNAQRHARRGV